MGQINKVFTAIGTPSKKAGETFRGPEEESENQSGEYHTRHRTPKPEAPWSMDGKVN